MMMMTGSTTVETVRVQGLALGIPCPGVEIQMEKRMENEMDAIQGVIGLILQILHDSKYLVLGELWFYRILSCSRFSINDNHKVADNSDLIMLIASFIVVVVIVAAAVAVSHAFK